MTRDRTFTTTLCWQEGEEDRELPVKVTYAYHAGYAGDRIDPPEDAFAEIVDIVPIDPGQTINFSRWQDDESLIAECLDDWADEDERAAEYAAEQRQEMRLMDWLA